MHLSEMRASPGSMKFAADFVLLWMNFKLLKNGRNKLTDCAGIYFFGGVLKKLWRGGQAGKCNFLGRRNKKCTQK
jgi:hypothetical protein